MCSTAIVRLPPHRNLERLTIPGEYWVSILLMCEAGTSLILCPVFGYLVDHARTRQFPFLSALVTLAGCMAILHTSHSLTMFVVGRVLQGCAGALVVVAAFALISDSVQQDRLGQTIGYLGSAIASGFLLGPFLGGVVYHAGGYDAVFWVAYAIIAMDFVLRLAMVEKRTAAKWQLVLDGAAEGEDDVHGHDSDPMVYEPDPVSCGDHWPLFRILRERRVLISSWALLVQGIFLSAFDAVYPCPRLIVCPDTDIADIVHLR